MSETLNQWKNQVHRLFFKFDKMKKIVLLFGFVLFANVLLHGQSNNDGFIGEMDHYKSNSIQVREIVRFFQDTCFSVFGCDSLKKIAFWGEQSSCDSLSEIRISPIILIDSKTISMFNKFGFVILMVDSVNVFISQWLLLNSPLKDSIEYLGKRTYELKYESFENCIKSYGANIIIDFECLPRTPMKVVSCFFYIPENGRKKLKKR